MLLNIHGVSYYFNDCTRLVLLTIVSFQVLNKYLVQSKIINLSQETHVKVENKGRLF